MMGLKMGYILPQARALAFELEWNYMFNQTIPSQVVSGVRESGKVDLNNFLVNVILRYPEGKIHPYVGGGIGASSMNIQNTESIGDVVVNVAEETATGLPGNSWPASTSIWRRTSPPTWRTATSARTLDFP